MAHRLLHTLVFSSTLLLDGCGSAASSDTDADDGTAAAETGGGEARNDTTPEPAVEGSASGALAYCEPGWPTTKGSSCSVDASGVTVCCSSYVPATGNVACCVQPQSPPATATGT